MWHHVPCKQNQSGVVNKIHYTDVAFSSVLCRIFRRGYGSICDYRHNPHVLEASDPCIRHDYSGKTNVEMQLYILKNIKKFKGRGPSQENLSKFSISSSDGFT